jgi:hypothetical protein
MATHLQPLSPVQPRAVARLGKIVSLAEPDAAAGRVKAHRESVPLWHSIATQLTVASFMASKSIESSARKQVQNRQVVRALLGALRIGPSTEFETSQEETGDPPPTRSAVRWGVVQPSIEEVRGLVRASDVRRERNRRSGERYAGEGGSLRAWPDQVRAASHRSRLNRRSNMARVGRGRPTTAE